MLLKKGILLSTALLMAEEPSSRASTYRRSLGMYGYRDWTRLRFFREFHWDKDETNFDGYLAPLVTITQRDAVEVDIREVRNICQSRDDLSDYRTIEQFANDLPKYYGRGTHADLDRCLGHLEVTCFGTTQLVGNIFTDFGWDDRLLFSNNNGSHNMAVARRIAIELGVRVPLKRPHEYHFLNADAVQALADKYALILLPNETWANKLPGALSSDGVPVVPGSFRAPPCYGDSARVLPLQRQHELSASAADYLRSSGFVDLVDHLVEDLQAQQSRHQGMS